jgi:hypothetical protein
MLISLETKAQEPAKGGENLVAVCGLYCGACPMYLATHGNDEQKRKQLVQQFSSGPMKLAWEDIQCDGCLGNGRLALFCLETHPESPSKTFDIF